VRWWLDVDTSESEMSGQEQITQNEILLMIGLCFPQSARAWRNNTGAYKSPEGQLIRYGCPGSPDILGIARGGVWFGIEVKSDTGRMSEAQKNFRNMVISMDGHYAMVRSVAEAKRFLEDVTNVGRE
jgi:hypothetical protein